MEARASVSAFRAGLTRASLASVVGAVAFACLELLVFALVVDEHVLARLPPSFLKENEADDRARITVDACRARYVEPESGVNVYYLGSSTARLVLLDTDRPAPIEHDLSVAVGEPVRFWNFTANGETIEEYIVIAEHLPAGGRGVVVAPFSDTRHDHLERAPTGKRRRLRELLGLDVSGLGSLAAAMGELPAHNTGVFFFDHIDFFTARRQALARLVMPKRGEPLPHRRGNVMRFISMAQHMDVDVQMLQVLERHVRLMRQLARITRERGLDLVILESPVAPVFDAAKPTLRAAYDEKITELARSLGAEYWDLNAEADLRSEDFYDPVHVGEDAARSRYQGVFVEHLAALLKTLP